MCSSNKLLAFSKIFFTISISLLFSFNTSKNCSMLLDVLNISYIESGDYKIGVCVDDDDYCATIDDDSCGSVFDDGNVQDCLVEYLILPRPDLFVDCEGLN